MRLHSGLFLGVSLSAAARSAAALVYDKLTPNCHLLNLIWKKADIIMVAASMVVLNLMKYQSEPYRE